MLNTKAILISIIIIQLFDVKHTFVSCQGEPPITQTDENKSFKILIDLNNQSEFSAEIDKTYDVWLSCPGITNWTAPIPLKARYMNDSTQINIHIPSGDIETRRQLRGYYRCCEDDIPLKTVWNEQPDCCPSCCPWYLVRKCQKIDVPNCKSLFLYTDVVPKIDSGVTLHSYKKVQFLVPCFAKTPKSNLKIVLHHIIDNFFHENISLYDTNKNIQEQYTNFQPEKGLCIDEPNKILKKKRTKIECIYENKEQLKIPTAYSSWSDGLKNSISILTNANEYIPLKRENNHLLLGQSITLRCMATLKFKEHYPPHDVCFMWTFHTSSSLSNTSYECIPFDRINKNYFEKFHTYRMDSVPKDLKRISCWTRQPANSTNQRGSFSSEYPVLIHPNNIFQLTGDLSKEKVLHIDEDKKRNFSFEFPFEHSSDVYLVNCTLGQYQSTTYRSPVKFTISALIFNNGSNINLTCAERNESVTVTYTIKTHSLSDTKPIVSGMQSLIKVEQNLTCATNISQPYSVTWRLWEEGTTKNISIKNDKSYKFTPKGDHFCVSCQPANQVESIVSNISCVDLYDVRLNPKFKVQIVNFRSESGLKNESFAAVAENKPFNFSCVWKKKYQKKPLNIQSTYIVKDNQRLTENDDFQILRNESSTTIKISFRTRKASLNMSGIYACQLTVNKPSISRINLKVYSPKPPHITTPKNNEKRSGIVGEQLIITCKAEGMPVPKLMLYKLGASTPIDEKEEDLANLLDGIYWQKRGQAVLEYKIKKVKEHDFGTYKCEAKNILGQSDSAKLQIGYPTKMYPAIIVVLIVALAVTFFAIVILCRRKTVGNITIISKENEMYIMSKLIESTQLWSTSEEQNKWMLSPSTVERHDRIGGGNYGNVFIGTYYRYEAQPQTVAIKQAALLGGRGRHISGLNIEERNAIIDTCFRNEVRILSLISGTQNIVNMIGCVLFGVVNNLEEDQPIETLVKRQYQLWMVMEYCPRGSIQDYIRLHAETFSTFGSHNVFIPSDPTYTTMTAESELTLLDLCQFSRGIANGLAYLAWHQVIHRDLATRNVLLDNNLNPKICDFGLAVLAPENSNGEIVYTISNPNKELPFKIMAPEALSTRTYYLSSDIWSYGLLLWQMFHLEKKQLFSDAVCSEELYRRFKINEGCFLDFPELAPKEIRKIMSNCWKMNPDLRPNPEEIVSQLDLLISEMEKRSSVVEHQIDSQRSTMISSVGGSSIGQSPTNNNFNGWNFQPRELIHEDNYGICNSITPLLNNNLAVEHHTYVNQSKPAQ